MDLKGHRAAVYSVDFSADGKMVATVSRDGFLMIWNINVRYREQESCKLVMSIKPEGPARLDRVRLSPDSTLAAISEGSSVWFFSTADGRHMEKIENCTPAKSPSSGDCGRILKMEFLGGKENALVTLCEVDKFVRVWRAPIV